MEKENSCLASVIQSRLVELQTYYNDLLEKYYMLNAETKGNFDWRQHALETKVETIEAILRGEIEVEQRTWSLCYEEDYAESEKLRERVRDERSRR